MPPKRFKPPPMTKAQMDVSGDRLVAAMVEALKSLAERVEAPPMARTGQEAATVVKISDEERERLKQENRLLIAELKQLQADAGNRGLARAVFLEGWDGTSLRGPKLP